MNNINCVITVHFDTAHRIIGHEDKCKYLHGHRYTLEVSVSAPKLDKLGRVIDFGVVKAAVKEWINLNWDHNVILSEEDSSLGEAIARITGQSIYYLPYNTTAENIAKYFAENVVHKIGILSRVQIAKIRLWETPNCYVEIW